MFLKKLFTIVFSIACLLSASTSALACACCVNPGYYGISVGKPSDYDLSIIDELKFDSGTELYFTEAGMDGVKGLAQLKADEAAGRSTSLDLVQEFLAKKWKFKFETSAGAKGVLELPMPATMVKYKVDIHDTEPDRETSLYKEFRFNGTVSRGTGFFLKDIVRPTTYFLVLQGRGNGCDNASDFTHWRLEIEGPRAEYSFLGKLK